MDGGVVLLVSRLCQMRTVTILTQPFLET